MEKCCGCKKLMPRDEHQKKIIETRLNRISGQINGIKNMIAEDRYCDDILIQLSAVDNSVKSLASLILDEHLRSCITQRLKNGEDEAVDEIIDIFKRFS